MAKLITDYGAYGAYDALSSTAAGAEISTQSLKRTIEHLHYVYAQLGTVWCQWGFDPLLEIVGTTYVQYNDVKGTWIGDDLKRWPLHQAVRPLLLGDLYLITLTVMGRNCQVRVRAHETAAFPDLTVTCGATWGQVEASVIATLPLDGTHIKVDCRVPVSGTGYVSAIVVSEGVLINGEDLPLVPAT